MGGNSGGASGNETGAGRTERCRFMVSVCSTCDKGRREDQRTRHNIARVHGILVLNEAEAIHQLDLSDLSSAMGRKMGLDISLGR